MSIPILLVTFLIMLLQSFSLSDLTQYRGRNRLLLVFAPTVYDPRLQKQNELIAGSQAAFRERDLRRFDILERGSSAVRLRARYHIKPGSFRVLLIGKDGHIALSQAMPITLRELAGQIDQMPMRQEEMRQEEMRQEEMRQEEMRQEEMRQEARKRQKEKR